MNNSGGFKDTLFCKKNTCNIGGKLLSIESPVVMGILNVTPDSFYIGSRFESEKVLLEKAGEMLTAGAAILDIGGYSTRPGAAEVSQTEELKRVVHAISLIKKEFPEAMISIDTFRAATASAAVSEGASIINDVSGGTLDETMFKTVGELKVTYVLMHMKGTPQTMISLSGYENFEVELIRFFRDKISEINNLGVHDIILDPGFGFAKNINQNFQLLRNLKIFEILGLPVLAGISRKSMVYKTIGKDPQNALAGTVALNMVALQNGANILRVHDVVEAIDTIKLFKALYF